MSTPTESPQLPPTPEASSKPPIYRNRVALIVTGAVVLALVGGGSAAAVVASQSTTTRNLASASSHHAHIPKALPAKQLAPVPTPTSPATQPVTAMPTAAPTITAPQAGASAVNPPAPPAPPAPVPPANTGPSRTSTPTILTFAVTFPASCTNGYGAGYGYARIEWTSQNASSAKLSDTLDFIPSATINATASGYYVLNIPCSSHDTDTVTLKVLGPTVPAKAASQSLPVAAAHS